MYLELVIEISLQQKIYLYLIGAVGAGGKLWSAGFVAAGGNRRAIGRVAANPIYRMALCCGFFCYKLFINNCLHFIFYEIWRRFFDLYMLAIIKGRVGAQLFCQIGQERVMALKGAFED